MDENVYEALHAADLGRVGSRLLRHGLAIAKAYGNRLSTQDVEDVVGGVLEELCLGKASWDPHRGPLYPFAMKVFERRLIDAARRQKSAKLLYGVLDSLSSERDTAETRLIGVETDEEISARVGLVFEACDADPEALAVLECIIDGVEPRPRFIAEATGKTVSEINTILRRVRRRALAPITERGNHGKVAND